MIRFACPSCGTSLMCRKEAAGRRRPCPRCRAVVVILHSSADLVRGVREEPVILGIPAAAADGSRSTTFSEYSSECDESPGLSKVGGLFIALGITIALTSGTALVVFRASGASANEGKQTTEGKVPIHLANSSTLSSTPRPERDVPASGSDSTRGRHRRAEEPVKVPVDPVVPVVGPTAAGQDTLVAPPDDKDGGIGSMAPSAGSHAVPAKRITAAVEGRTWDLNQFLSHLEDRGLEFTVAKRATGVKGVWLTRQAENVCVVDWPNVSMAQQSLAWRREDDITYFQWGRFTLFGEPSAFLAEIRSAIPE